MGVGEPVEVVKMLKRQRSKRCNDRVRG